MVLEVIGIAVAILAVIIAVLIFNSERRVLAEVRSLNTNTNLSLVDEKIAMLLGYAGQVITVNFPNQNPPTSQQLSDKCRFFTSLKRSRQTCER